MAEFQTPSERARPRLGSPMTGSGRATRARRPACGPGRGWHEKPGAGSQNPRL